MNDDKLTHGILALFIFFLALAVAHVADESRRDIAALRAAVESETRRCAP